MIVELPLMPQTNSSGNIAKRSNAQRKHERSGQSVGAAPSTPPGTGDGREGKDEKRWRCVRALRKIKNKE